MLSPLDIGRNSRSKVTLDNVISSRFTFSFVFTWKLGFSNPQSKANIGISMTKEDFLVIKEDF